MAWHVFYSYSHKDAEFRDRLSTYLRPLERQGKIVEWYDRKIEPGANWKLEIDKHLDTAHLILLLVSENFLESDYCFGLEMDRAFDRVKQDNIKVVPILLKPCLWHDMRFSDFNPIPRDDKPIISWPSQEEGFIEVAREIRKIVSEPPPSSQAQEATQESEDFRSAPFDIVKGQVHACANLYEKIRHRMRPSNERTQRMEQVFQNLRALATASYPMLEEFTNSPLPGEKLTAVAILQVIASPRYLSFLVEMVGKEQPFIGYHAAKALYFAVGAIEPHDHSELLQAIRDAQLTLKSASIGFDTDRQKILMDAEEKLINTIDLLAERNIT